MNTTDCFNNGDRVTYQIYTATVILSIKNHGIRDYEGYVLCQMDPPFVGWDSRSSGLFPDCLRRSEDLINLQWIHPDRIELIGIYDGYEIDE